MKSHYKYPQNYVMLADSICGALKAVIFKDHKRKQVNDGLYFCLFFFFNFNLSPLI